MHTDMVTIVHGQDSMLEAEHQWFKFTSGGNGVTKCELFMQSRVKQKNGRMLFFFSTERLADTNQVNKKLIGIFRQIPLEFAGGHNEQPVVLLNYHQLEDRIRQDVALGRSPAARFYLDSNAVKKMIGNFFMADAKSYLLKEKDTLKGLAFPVALQVTENNTRQVADSIYVDVAMVYNKEENMIGKRKVRVSGRVTRHLWADKNSGLFYSAVLQQRVRCRFPENSDSMTIVSTKRIVRIYEARQGRRAE
ncbi:hypothetical protein [Chitinophaga alhagiae]|uniref:hypothetical protein n=1 Tax=Chitinophaga alhagiae TaxID=2203219 RepID=UPI001300884C|nr:hypothetical protein [Chitinophaga alhagiae]